MRKEFEHDLKLVRSEIFALSKHKSFNLVHVVVDDFVRPI